MNKRIIIIHEERDCKNCLKVLYFFLTSMGYNLKLGRYTKDKTGEEVWRKQ